MKKGNITVLASVMMMLLIAMAVGAGTMAYFSDVETSEGNTLTAGTLDLKLGDPESIIINLGDIRPGDTGRGVIKIKNTGTITDGLYMTLHGGWPLTEPSETEPGDPKLVHDVSANEFASAIHITLMVYAVDIDNDGELDQDEIDAALAWPQTGCDYIDGPDDDVFDMAPGANGNGISDLYDFCRFFHAPQGLVTTWDGDGFFVFDWEFMPNPAQCMGNVDDTGITCDNDFQGDGVEFELTFTLWHGSPP